MGLLLGGVVLMGNVGLFGAVWGVLTEVDFRDGEDSVVSVLMLIGAIIILRSV